MGPLGSAGPAVDAAASVPGPFHDIADDIADGSTNLYDPAVPGYDNATGLGSLEGARLIAELAPAGKPDSSPYPPWRAFGM